MYNIDVSSFSGEVISKIRESLLSEDLILLEYDALADYKKQEHSSQQVDWLILLNTIQNSASGPKFAINSRKIKNIRKVLDQLDGSGHGSDVLDSGPGLSIEEKHQHFQVKGGGLFQT